MQSDGCIMLVLIGGFVVVPIAGILYGAKQRRKAEAEQRRLAAEQQYARGVEITRLYAQLAGGVGTDAVTKPWQRLQEIGAAGYHEQLTAQGGWFDRAAPHLRAMATQPANASFVERYFLLFTFPAGQQAKALEFLHPAAPRATQLIMPDLAMHERAAGARSRATRGRVGHNTVLGGTTERCTSGRGVGRAEGTSSRRRYRSADHLNPTIDHFRCPQVEIEVILRHFFPIEDHFHLSSR